MPDDILDTVKAAIQKLPDLIWLSESGTSWCDDDENAAIMAVLTAAPALVARCEQAEAKAEQYRIDWMAAKAEFGDRIAALRQRHAEAVKAAFIEGLDTDREYFCRDGSDSRPVGVAAWLASEAKKGLT